MQESNDKKGSNKELWGCVGAIGGALVTGIISLIVASPILIPFFFPTPTPIATNQLQPTINSTPSIQTPSPVNPIFTATAESISESRISEKDGMKLLYVPSGVFVMGSQVKANPDEQPVHAVNLSAFWIDETEITNKQYAICVSAGACVPPLQINSYTNDWYYGNPKFDNYPVIYVTWDNAKTYCKWTGRDLPTEAQWEKAASWDDKNQQSFVYPWGDKFNGAFVNFCDVNCLLNHADKNSNDGYSDTSPVMNYPNGISPYGAYDMAGNVWEWVNDWYDENYYSSSPATDPLGANSGLYRILKGDSWFGYSYGVRSADRNSFTPSKSANNIGFRCAISNP